MMADMEMEVGYAESDMIPLPVDPEPSRLPAPHPVSVPPPPITPRTLIPPFTKIATNDEIARNLGLLPGTSPKKSKSAKSSKTSSSSTSLEKTNGKNEKMNSERDIPPVEYAELRKEFNKKVQLTV